MGREIWLDRMILLMKKVYRKVMRRMDDIARRRHVSEVATRSDVLDFWRDHGAQWATEEASSEDRARIAQIAQKIKGMSDERATEAAVSELQSIWQEGFPSGDDAFGWNEMNDRLPDAAMLAFVRGVASA
tara:strand:- start:2316 stop:2705 length:390 start_codon:yes stop_codon:yes gene_type:complete